MSETTDNTLTSWLKQHAVGLATLQPNAPLDDLEPLREIVGDARVVAIGENSHFIREFALLRHRVIRFLVERCDFTIHAMEFGFSEGFGVDRWMQGAGDDDDLDGHLGPFPYPVEVRATLRWLRVHNRDGASPVRFAGIDVPCAGGSLLPALESIAEFLTDADPDALPWLDRVRALARKVDATSMAAAAPLLGTLSSAEQDALTASLSRLAYRLRAMQPQHVARFGQERFDLAMHHLQGACYAGYNLHAMLGFIAGTGLPGDTGARDSYMADSVLWHLEHAAPQERIVLVAHNAHIQKAPVIYDGLCALPMGQRLADALGNDYLSLAMTSAAGNTAGLYPDEAAPHGFRVEKTPLAPPAPDSIEAALAAADLGLGLVDLRGAPRVADTPSRMRYDTDYLDMLVFDAFDGVFHVPSSTVVDDIGI